MVISLTLFYTFDNALDLTEQDLAELTDGSPQNRDCGVGVKAAYQSKIIRGKEVLRINAASGEGHKGNALANKGSKLLREREVSVLQGAAAHDRPQLRIILLDALGDKMRGGLSNGCGEVCCA